MGGGKRGGDLLPWIVGLRSEFVSWPGPGGRVRNKIRNGEVSSGPSGETISRERRRFRTAARGLFVDII